MPLDYCGLSASGSFSYSLVEESFPFLVAFYKIARLNFHKIIKFSKNRCWAQNCTAERDGFIFLSTKAEFLFLIKLRLNFCIFIRF